jgi:hypothetical protein
VFSFGKYVTFSEVQVCSSGLKLLYMCPHPTKCVSSSGEYRERERERERERQKEREREREKERYIQTYIYTYLQIRDLLRGTGHDGTELADSGRQS